MKGKRWLLLFFTLIVLIGGNTSSYGEAVSLKIDGKDYGTSIGVLVGPETIYVDMAKLANELGYYFRFDQAEGLVNLVGGDKNLSLYVGRTEGLLNGQVIDLTYPIRLEGARVYSSLDLYSDYLNKLVYIDYDYLNISLEGKTENRESFFKRSDKLELSKELEDFIGLYEEKQNFQGAVLVARDDEILLNRGFGYSNRELAIKNDSQTKFPISSLTKQFLGVGIIKMKTGGKLDFNDPISKYIGGFKSGDKISIHNLLTHTSGLKDITRSYEFYQLEDSSGEKVLDLVRGEDLIFEPGEKMEYNHVNYIVLGEILEKLSGQTLEDYFYYNFFKPLGMKSTGLAYGKRSGFNIATPYEGYMDLYEIEDKIMLSKLHGAGSIYSTVEDMYRWTEALEGEVILSKEEKEILFKGYEDMGNMTKYSYGLMVGELGKYNFYQHDGSTFGFSSLLSKIDEKDLTVIILANKRQMDLYKINGGLQRISQGAKVDLDGIPKFPKEIKLDKKAYENYEGTYSLTSPIDGFVFSMKVFQKEEELFLQVDNQDPIRIYPMGNDSFFTREIEASLKFHLEDGRAEALTLTQMDVKFYGKRKNNN